MIEALHTLYSHGVITSMEQDTENKKFSDLLVVRDPQVLKRFLALIEKKKKKKKKKKKTSDGNDGDNGNNDGDNGPLSGNNGGNNNKPTNENNKGEDDKESDDEEGLDDDNNPHGGAVENVNTSALITNGNDSLQEPSRLSLQDNPSQQDFDLSAKAYREMMAQAKSSASGKRSTHMDPK